MHHHLDAISRWTRGAQIVVMSGNNDTEHNVRRAKGDRGQLDVWSAAQLSSILLCMINNYLLSPAFIHQNKLEIERTNEDSSIDQHGALLLCF